MKILIITPRFHTNLYFRVKALIDGGHKVKIIAQHKGFSENHDILEPVIIGFSPVYKLLDKIRIKLFGDTLSYFWKLNLAVPDRKKLKKEIKDFNADITIIKGMQNIFTLISLFFTREKSFLLIQARKHFADTKKKALFLFFLKKILRVRAIITPLKNILEEKDNYFNYIPFVIKTKEFKKEYFRKNRINIIDIGKYEVRKDHFILLQAIKKLKNKYNIFLTIIGEKVLDGTYDALLEYIRKNKMENIVELRVNIPFKEVQKQYRNYDLYVLPSHREQAAYSILEAMANKLPVICSDTCGTQCYIKDSENGLVFKSRDDNDLTDKIKEIIKDKDKLRKMGNKSFEIVKKNHSLKLFSEEIEKLER